MAKKLIAVTVVILGLVTTKVACGESIRVIVGFHGAPDSAVFNSHGGNPRRLLVSANAIAGTLPGRAIGRVKRIANVAYVVEDVIVTAVKGKPPGKGGGGKDDGTPAPQEFPWGIDRIDSELAWNESRGAGVRVAIVDTGIDLDHPDLTPRVVDGANFVNSKKSADDDNGHGTHVAGVVGASDNTLGVVGVAPLATLLAVKVLDRNGSGWLSAVLAGIDWAAANGAQVINLSLGTSSDIQVFEDTVDSAVSSGVVVVAAAGNSALSGNSASYPGAYDSVIGVGATDSTDARASFSTFGPQLDLAAPGVDIKSTWKKGGYNTISGTSMSSPHVAGAAALAIGTGIYGDNAAVRAALESTADDLGPAGRDDEFGHGLVDAEEVVTGTQTNP